MGKWKGKRKIEKEGKGEKESEEEWDKVWVREREGRVFRVQKEDMSIGMLIHSSSLHC